MQAAPVLFVLVAAASCGGAKPQPAPVALTADASAAPDSPPAPPTARDAGAQPAASAGAGAMTKTTPMDAGAATSGAQATATGGGVRPTPPGPSKIHDRLLGKVKDKGAFDEAAMASRIEKATGADVAKVKLGPGSYAVINFAPTTPPRDAAAQKKLVEKLQASGLFDAVEGDKVMMLK